MEWLAQAGLGNAAVATLLALLAAAAALARRPALTHGLWLLVLIKLVTPPVAPVAFLPAQAADDTAVVGPQEPAAEPIAIEVPDALAVAELSATVPAEPVVRIQPPLAPYRWPFVAWGLGAFAWWSLAACRIARFQRALCGAQPAGDDIQDQLRSLASGIGLKRAPRAVFVPGRVPPLIWSIGGRPRLVLPQALWSDLEPAAREALLIHELAHLRRRDHWTRWLELLTGGLYWWHPVVWWARRALRSVEEQCCDAWVVAARPDLARTYARALLATLDFLSDPRVATPMAASGIGHVSCLKRRMTMIVRAQTPQALSWRGRLAVLTLGATLLPLAPTWAQRDEPRKETTPAPEKEAGAEKPRDLPPPAAAREMTEQYRRAVEARLGEMDKSLTKRLDEAFVQMEKAFQAGKISEDELRRNLERVRREVSEAMERARLAQRQARDEGDRRRRAAPPETPERRDQVEKARAEVRELQAKLREAEGRLAKLEGRPFSRYTVLVPVRSEFRASSPSVARPVPESGDHLPDARSERERPRPRDGERRPDGPAPEERSRDNATLDRTPAVPEHRVRHLEERLDSLMREMQEIKSELRGGEARPSSPDAPKGR